jgi:hypothetical protein
MVLADQFTENALLKASVPMLRKEDCPGMSILSLLDGLPLEETFGAR